jgi:hypothetical protein
MQRDLPPPMPRKSPRSLKHPQKSPQTRLIRGLVHSLARRLAQFSVGPRDRSSEVDYPAPSVAISSTTERPWVGQQRCSAKDGVGMRHCAI